jgi:hypothetical protein
MSIVDLLAAMQSFCLTGTSVTDCETRARANEKTEPQKKDQQEHHTRA